MGSYDQYKAPLFDVVSMLRQLEDDLSNYKLLFVLQQRLVRLICRAERRIIPLEQLHATLNDMRRLRRHTKTDAAGHCTRMSTPTPLQQ